jgi:hypothetical protein
MGWDLTRPVSAAIAKRYDAGGRYRSPEFTEAFFPFLSFFIWHPSLLNSNRYEVAAKGAVARFQWLQNCINMKK